MPETLQIAGQAVAREIQRQLIDARGSAEGADLDTVAIAQAALASLQPRVSEMRLRQLLLGAGVRLYTEDGELGRFHLVELAFDAREDADAVFEALFTLSPEGEP